MGRRGNVQQRLNFYKIFREYLKKYFYKLFMNISVTMVTGAGSGERVWEERGAGLISIKFPAGGKTEDVFL